MPRPVRGAKTYTLICDSSAVQMQLPLPPLVPPCIGQMVHRIWLDASHLHCVHISATPLRRLQRGCGEPASYLLRWCLVFCVSENSTRSPGPCSLQAQQTRKMSRHEWPYVFSDRARSCATHNFVEFRSDCFTPASKPIRSNSRHSC